jgi:hypothetical protein
VSAVEPLGVPQAVQNQMVMSAPRFAIRADDAGNPQADRLR